MEVVLTTQSTGVWYRSHTKTFERATFDLFTYLKNIRPPPWRRLLVSAERLPASFQPTHSSADSANVIYRFLDYRSYAKTFERAEFNQFTPGSRIVRLPGSHTKLSGRLHRQFSWPSVDRHVGRKVARVNMVFSHVFGVVWAKQASWLSMVRLVARLTEIWRATKHMARRVTYRAL